MDYFKLSKTKVFEGYGESDLKDLLNHLDTSLVSYKRGQAIYTSGQKVERLGLVENGSVKIQNIDIFGNSNILSLIEEGDIFAEAYSFFKEESLSVDVVANEDSQILFFDPKKLFKMTSSLKDRLLENLLLLTARRNLKLTQRIFHTSSKSIRGRVLSYLSHVASKSSSKVFTIPFDRKGLADYLSLDRSALSKELGKMKKDGIIDFYKNTFQIKTK